MVDGDAMKRAVGRLCLLAVLAFSGVTWAQALDNVYLTNGGRVRGQVMEDDGKGVSVLLADGSTRKIPRAEVMRVEYAGSAASAAPPVPAAPRMAGEAAPPGAATGPAPSPPAMALASTQSPLDALGRGDSSPAPATGSYDRLTGSPIVAFFDVGAGYGHVWGGSDVYDIDADAAQLTMSLGLGFPIGGVLALGAGGSFNPVFNDDGFGPAGFFGLYLAVYPIPHTGLNTSLLFGFGGGGVGGVYGGIGPGGSVGVGYDFQERRGPHLTVGMRLLYQPYFDQAHTDNFYNQLGVTLNTGVSFH